MTNITWPSSLPQVIILDGLNAKKQTSRVRTQMDSGPAKQRRRYTVATKEFSGSIIVSESQRQTLSSWYGTVLGGGVLRFMMKDPQTLQPGEFRFMEDYDEDSLDGNWKITMKLEKMNA